MRRGIKVLLLALTMLFFLPASGLCTTRALLVACKEFITQPNLGSTVSGNLHMIGSALLGAGLEVGDLSIEDGTIGTSEALQASVTDSFFGAKEGDLSILYLCTHGLLASADDEQVYLLLGDGQQETPLGAQDLYSLLHGIPGEKLLIVDACFSGALIGRGTPGQYALPGVQPEPSAVTTPFLQDASIHVLTSADGTESSWYYDSEGLANGAVSYFASALSSGLGLYGHPEADSTGDGLVSLEELVRYLRVAVPSSSTQVLSADAASLMMPVTEHAMLFRPLSGFSYGVSLLTTDSPELDFSFTVSEECAVQYRVIDFDQGRWNWDEAITFLDAGDNENGRLSPGRKTRTLSLDGIGLGDSGYVMLQVFSVSGAEVILCSERLMAVQPADSTQALHVASGSTLRTDILQEMPIRVTLDVPAELTVSVFDTEGHLVRRLASSQLTRPAPDSTAQFYWDGRDAEGKAVPAGEYTIAAEARIGTSRQKATAGISVRSSAG